MKKEIWKNRIVGYGEKPAKDFIFNPLNWRMHPEFQRRALHGILREVGWVTGVIENVTTGHLLDGHARIEEALAKDENEMVPFIKVELTEEEERKVLAVLDPIGALAGTDDNKLKELSSILSFESDALGELMRQREISEIDFGDFFEFKETGTPVEKFLIELEFNNETEFREVLEKLAAISASPAEAVKMLLAR